MSRSIVTSKTAKLLAFSLLLGAGVLSSSFPLQAKTVTLVTRSERCDRLKRQLQAALANRPETRRTEQAEALQKKGMKFCASKRQAQGMRAYAKGLKLLGLKPDMAEAPGPAGSIPSGGNPETETKQGTSK